ncbi:hypothetical protein SO802_002428 [Lithocarpus litseifolius]|uniref:RNase H type-1 domain-containing protein n=1 Tax=Lithocarpus litseifolius TaxID=425828 RepID=A0AAW2DZ25_9ROSI
MDLKDVTCGPSNKPNGSQGTKKGSWIRLPHKPKENIEVEAQRSGVGMKCKTKGADGSKEGGVENEKKQKMEEETKKLKTPKEGRVVGACSKKIMAPLGAMETEAKAFEFGLQFVRDILIHDLVLEGDSLVIVNALMEASPPLASVAAVLYNVSQFPISSVVWSSLIFVGKATGQPIY